jgi:DNA polymerase-3 subunit alpha
MCIRDRSAAAGLSRVQDAVDDIVVLVQDAHGYRNLLALLAIAHLGSEGVGDPRISYRDLEQHAEGLIVLTGGPSGPVGRLLSSGQRDAAAGVLRRLMTMFPDRLYVEIMRHGEEVESQIEPLLLDLAERHTVPLVATNETFFPTKDMFEAHDALICIAEGALVASPDRRRLTPEHAFKRGEQMAELFADLPDAIENTLLIARRCAFMIEPVKPILPAYDAGTDRSEEEVLREQARSLLEVRLRNHVLNRGGSAAADEDIGRRYRERLDYELDVICQMGFPGYFLIVADFILWARARGIPVGPGRGSGAGSVVAWALTITDLDPLRFGLLFERFLNPERISMPDFDIDFCQERRDEVIRHVQEKYGRDRVAQIITFGKLQARAVLRDVGRVLGMPYGYVDRICKLVPNNPAHPVTLKQAIEGEPQLQAMISEDESVARLVGIASRLEGLNRHASTHAAGVVIGDRPLQELIPLYRDPRSDLPVTGFNMKWVESAGLVKFDFLGLKTLTVLARAVQLLTAAGMTSLDLSDLPLDDKRTFELLGRGDTVGVFQLESAGMRDVLRRMKPDKFEDIIAVVSLYRPGPMDNIPSYIRRKHGEEEPDYLYPTLAPILEETYGIIIYQEQVMQIAQELSGYSLGSADILRRAMGKKNKDEMERQKEIFVGGAKARGVPEGKAYFIFDLVNKFAGYGFNKSHAAAYALVAYQTAYLKANFPVAFFAASLSLEIDHPEKINVFRQELDRIGIALLPPDINASDANFIAEPGETMSAGAIRYGLAGVKNVGQAAMEALVSERRQNGAFVSLDDFCRRLNPRHVNKRQLENLARAGAFDRLNANRRQVFEAAETILRHAGAAVRERNSSQMGLFGAKVDSVVS